VNQLKELPLSASSFTTFGEKKNLTQTIQHQQKVVSTKHVWSLYGIFILRYFPHHISNTSSIDQPFTNKRGPRLGLNFRGRLSLWILRLLIGPPVARWASVCVVCWGGFLLPKLTSRNPGNIKYKKKTLNLYHSIPLTLPQTNLINTLSSKMALGHARSSHLLASESLVNQLSAVDPGFPTRQLNPP
jgi:hypothetical protein